MSKLARIIVLLVILVPTTYIGVKYTLDQPNIAWWHSHYSDNCGWLTHCDNYNGSITTVHDYEIQCTGPINTVSTCPRENLGVSVSNGENISLTLNCHYYHVGDSVTMIRQLDYYAGSNRTQTSWSIQGSPC